jgi:hypothetical protein
MRSHDLSFISPNDVGLRHKELSVFDMKSGAQSGAQQLPNERPWVRGGGIESDF